MRREAKGILVTAGVIFILLLATPGHAATAPKGAGEKGPRIGLVLSGGGARGLAHVGVIRALEENHIRIDAIAGTSIGAIVGALYASGRSPAEIEEISANLDWASAFADQPSRENLSYRRKQDSRDYLVKAQATLKKGVISLPKGVVQGQNLQQILQDLFIHVSDITDFDRLPIPFRAVAADLATGDEVVLARGDLATTVRASMSIPALYAPVEHDGMLLVDGGVANNLPVDVAKRMGVDYVIAVDIATPLYSAEELTSVVPIIEQLTTLLTVGNAERQIALMTGRDVLIQPALKEVQSADFDKSELAISAGYTAANSALAGLTYLRQEELQPERRDIIAPAEQIITGIVIDNDSRISERTIAARIHQRVGKPFDKQQLLKDAQTIYGLGYFSHVSHELAPADEGALLHIATREKSWGQDLVGVTFELFTDNAGDNAYNLGGNYRKIGITPKGGDWFSVAQIGRNPQLRTELYLPLDYRQRFFLLPYVRYSETRYNVVDSGDILARFNIDDLIVGTLIGTELSNVALIGIGAEHHSGHSDTFVGIDQGTSHFKNANGYLLFEYDSMDNIYFPRHGALASTRYDHVRPRISDFKSFNLLKSSLLSAFSMEKSSLLVGAQFVRSTRMVVQPLFQSSLGGFLHLSGFPDNALVGSNLVFGRLTWLRRLDEQSFLPVDLPVYLALSVEAGNVWQSKEDISIDDLIYAGSVVLGVDSPLGPLYVGYGKTQEGISSFYLRLGRVF